MSQCEECPRTLLCGLLALKVYTYQQLPNIPFSYYKFPCKSKHQYFYYRFKVLRVEDMYKLYGNDYCSYIVHKIH